MRHWMIMIGAWMLMATSTQAAIVSSSDVMAGYASGSAHHEKVKNFLQRDEVKAQLEAWGVKSADAQAQVDTLNDEQLARLSAQIDTMPAGGDIIGTAVFVFLVLLLTDILGFTEIFPFTRSVR